MNNMISEKSEAFDTAVEVPSYSVHYQYGSANKLFEVRDTSLRALFAKYGDILWLNGSHKYNVTNFIAELHDMLDVPGFSTFSQEMLDQLIGKLRKRGNSNATINRKMAALSKLLRKAYKMGDVYSLPEFKREKEKAGRIRFLDRDEEEMLFSEIRAQNELYYRFCSDRRFPGPFSEIDQQRFRIAWHNAKDAVGLGDDKDVVPHVLRHTCASRLVQGGIDIRRVQMWLGHQTLTMTMRYAHLASHDLDMCVPVLERAAAS